MDVKAYLKRVDYSGGVEPAADNLRALHRAHLLTVPFENLDIHLGRRIVLDEASLFEKIVADKRGGFCYELNGLFAGLLRELGFRVTILNSLIPEKHNGCGLAFDHPILLVELDQRWMVDVGFGDAYRLPLNLDERGEQIGTGVAYKISPNDKGGWDFYERLESGQWEFYYAFTLQPCRLRDFSEACHHYETSPKSSFTQKRICTRATKDGHLSLADYRLINTAHGKRQERLLTSEEEYLQTLREQFGIEID